MNSALDRTNTAAVRLLLVDDHPAGLAARSSVLTELGFAISTAPSAELALVKFKAEPFALVVTDYKLPGMTGVDLIAGIRAIAPETRIILISGFVDALGLTELSTGADAVLTKSANEVTQLIRAVNRLLRRTVAKKPGTAKKLAAATKKVAGAS